MERVIQTVLKKLGKRTIAITLALLIIVGTLPIIISSADYVCGLEEHTHADECYEFVCTLTEGEQFDAHTHNDNCFTQTLVCECAEGDEHTSDCYVSEKICTLEEGESVLVV